MIQSPGRIGGRSAIPCYPSANQKLKANASYKPGCLIFQVTGPEYPQPRADPGEGSLLTPGESGMSRQSNEYTKSPFEVFPIGKHNTGLPTLSIGGGRRLRRGKCGQPLCRAGTADFSFRSRRGGSTGSSSSAPGRSRTLVHVQESAPMLPHHPATSESAAKANWRSGPRSPMHFSSARL